MPSFVVEQKALICAVSGWDCITVTVTLRNTTKLRYLSEQSQSVFCPIVIGCQLATLFALTEQLHQEIKSPETQGGFEVKSTTLDDILYALGYHSMHKFFFL